MIGLWDGKEKEKEKAGERGGGGSFGGGFSSPLFVLSFDALVSIAANFLLVGNRAVSVYL